MAFTKVVGAGIHTLSNITSHNINSSGIITATKFVGPFDGSSGDFSGDVTITGDLTVNGNTTTLDTTLQEVDQLFIDANNTTYAGIITQRGTGNLLGLFDGSTRVFNVADGGAISTKSLTVSGDIDIIDGDPRIKLTDSNASNAYAFIDGQAGKLKLFADLGNNVSNSEIIFGVDGSTPKMVIKDTGNIGIGTDDPSEKLSVFGNINIEGGSASLSQLKINSTGRYRGIQLDENGTRKAHFQHDATDNKTVVGTAEGTMQFNSGDTPRILLNSSGHWVPYVDSTYDLGLTGTRWRNVYADTLHGDGQNITGTTIRSNLTWDGTTLLANKASGVGYIASKGGTSGGDYGIVQVQSGSTVRGRLVADAAVDAFRLDSAGRANAPITFHTGSSYTERLRITSAGTLKFTGQNTSLETAGITHHTNNNLYIRGGTSGLVLGNHDSTNTIHISNSNYIKFETTDGTEKLRIDSSGRVGIGTDNPSNANGAAENLVVEGGNNTGLSIISGGASPIGSRIYFGRGYGGSDNRKGQINYLHTGDNADAFTFHTATTERLRITSDGKIGIGNIVSPINNVEIRTDAHGEGVTIKSTGNTSNALTFDANRGTQGVIGVVYGRWNGTTVSQMSFVSGDDGTDKNDGYITFGTESAASNGNVNATERLRIEADGSVGIGTNDASWGLSGVGGLIVGDGGSAQAITIFSGSSSVGDLAFADAKSGTARYRGLIRYDHNDNSMLFRTNSDKALLIDSSGRVAIGTDGYGNVAPLAPLHVSSYSPTTTITTFNHLRDASQLLLQTSNNVNNSRSGITFTGALHSTDGCSAGIIANHENVAENSESTSLSFYTSHNESLGERLRITSTGQIGLSGTPTHKLEIFNGSDTENILMIRGADATTEYAAMGVHSGNAVITGGGVGSTSAGISFRTAASGTEVERLHIASDGATKVCHNGGAFGVGGDPINKFGVASNDNNFFGLHRENATTGTGEFNINVEVNSQVTFSMDDEGAFSFGTSTDPSAQSGYSEKLRIFSDGKIVLGQDAENNAHALVTIHGSDTEENDAVSTLVIADTASYNHIPQMGITFKGHYHSNGAMANFAGIVGKKQNNGDGQYGGELYLFNRTHLESPKRRITLDTDGVARGSNGCSFSSLHSAKYYNTYNTAGWSASTFQNVIPTATLVNGRTYLIKFHWSHGGSGAPYLLSGSFLFCPNYPNSTGTTGRTHIPFQTAHTTHGTSRYFEFAPFADGYSASQGVRVQPIGWSIVNNSSTAGTFYIYAAEIGHN